MGICSLLFRIPERLYWNLRYWRGGISGRGSIGKYKEWKWDYITQVVGSIDSVIDVGCGDLSFWDGRLDICEGYLGTDVSDIIIRKNKTIHPDLQFIRGPAGEYIPNISARIVFCLDTLFHIMSEDRAIKTLENLCKYSTEWIVISTWRRNPFVSKGKRSHKHQYFHPLPEYESLFVSRGFTFHSVINSPFDELNTLYFYRRV